MSAGVYARRHAAQWGEEQVEYKPRPVTPAGYKMGVLHGPQAPNSLQRRQGPMLGEVRHFRGSSHHFLHFIPDLASF